MKGGPRNIKVNPKAKTSRYYPFANLSMLLLHEYIDKFQPSKAALNGM